MEAYKIIGIVICATLLMASVGSILMLSTLKVAKSGK